MCHLKLWTWRQRVPLNGIRLKIRTQLRLPLMILSRASRYMLLILAMSKPHKKKKRKVRNLKHILRRI
jgi:hypothetical protein